MANNRSDALNLITQRGEGLVKIINSDSDFSITLKPDKAIYDRLNAKWGAFFQNMLASQLPGLTRDQSLLGTAIAEEKNDGEILNFRDDPSHLTTHVSLLPRTGQMELLDIHQAHGVGLLLDLSECDLREQAFGGEMGVSPHWLENSSLRTTRYNDLKVGVRPRATAAIVMQSATPEIGEVPHEETLNHRFDAIYRKLYFSYLFDRHLPIIILHANEPPREYTLAEQHKDLQDFLRENPTNTFAKSLLERNDALEKTILLEVSRQQPTVLPQADIANYEIIHSILLEKITLLGEEAAIIKSLAAVEAELKSSTDAKVLEMLDEKKASLEEAYDDLRIMLTVNNSKLESFEIDPKKFIPLYKLLQIQENTIAALQGRQRDKSKLIFNITAEEMEASLPRTHFKWIKTEGLVYSKDKYSKASGSEQLFSDFSRKLEVFGESSETTSFKTLPDFLAYVKQKVTPEQFQQLETHYSQGPLLFGFAVFGDQILNEEGMLINHPLKDDITNQLYLEDGEIKLKCRFERYPVARLEDRELVDYINGPVEWTFKLTPAGFKFDNLKTSSPLLLMAFLGKELTLDFLQEDLHLNIDSPEILVRYKEAAANYLKHLELASDAKGRVKAHIMQDLLATLYQGEFGFLPANGSPLKKSHAEVLKSIAPYESAYLTFDRQLFFVDAKGVAQVQPKAKAADKLQDFADLIQRLDQVKMPVHSHSRRLSAVELEQIQQQTGRYHNLNSPQQTNKVFRHLVKEKEEILSQKRETAVVTGIKTMGTFAASFVPKKLLKETTQGKLEQVNVPHGLRFIKDLNNISKLELEAMNRGTEEKPMASNRRRH